jgi:hypothetical protein
MGTTFTPSSDVIEASISPLLSQYEILLNLGERIFIDMRISKSVSEFLWNLRQNLPIG